MSDEREKDVAELVEWLRDESEKAMKDAIAREEMAKSCLGGTKEDRREGHRLAETMMGRKLKKSTQEEENLQAEIYLAIAKKAESKSRRLSGWADMLAAHRPEPSANKYRWELIERIKAYLRLGGLFNAELADHNAVRDLLMDCSAALLFVSLETHKWPEPDALASSCFIGNTMVVGLTPEPADRPCSYTLRSRAAINCSNQLQAAKDAIVADIEGHSRFVNGNEKVISVECILAILNARLGGK